MQAIGPATLTLLCHLPGQCCIGQCLCDCETASHAERSRRSPEPEQGAEDQHGAQGQLEARLRQVQRELRAVQLHLDQMAQAETESEQEPGAAGATARSCEIEAIRVHCQSSGQSSCTWTRWLRLTRS